MPKPESCSFSRVHYFCFFTLREHCDTANELLNGSDLRDAQLRKRSLTLPGGGAYQQGHEPTEPVQPLEEGVISSNERLAQDLL
jgi:hypothetical protein